MISYNFSSYSKSPGKLKLKNVIGKLINSTNVKARGVDVMLWLRRPAVQNIHCKFKLVPLGKKQMSISFYNLQQTSDEHCQLNE